LRLVKWLIIVQRLKLNLIREELIYMISRTGKLCFFIFSLAFTINSYAIETKEFTISLDDYFPKTKQYLKINSKLFSDSSKLVIKKIESSCKCLQPISKENSNYSENLEFSYTTPEYSGDYKYKVVVIYKNNENESYKKAIIFLESEIINRISHSPEYLSLKLDGKNKSNKIKLVAKDKYSFKIKNVVANFSGLKFNYSKTCSTMHEIIVENNLKQSQPYYNHVITITTDHQYSPTINIPCKLIPLYTVNPNRLVFLDVVSDVKKTKKVKIASSRKLKPNIKSYVSRTGFLKLNKCIEQNEYEVELLVPKSYAKNYLKDTLIITTKAGKKINIPCLAWLKETPNRVKKITANLSKIQSLLNKSHSTFNNYKKGSILLSTNKIVIPYLSQGKIINFEERITNTGTEKYNLKIHSGCSSCSKTRLSKQTLQPGESCYLNFSTFQTAPGAFAQTLWLTEKNKKFSPQKIVISGKVKKEYDIYYHWQKEPKFNAPIQKVFSNSQKNGLTPIYLYVRVIGENNYDTAAVAKSIKGVSKYFKLDKYHFISNPKGKLHVELIFKFKDKINQEHQYKDWIGMNFENILKLSKKVTFSIK